MNKREDKNVNNNSNNEIILSDNVCLSPKIQNMTISDLLRNENITLVKKKNQVHIQTEIDKTIINLGFRHYPNGIMVSQSNFEVSGQKKELIKTILQMKKEKYTQSEIAEQLNMSQSYVSKLLKDRK